MLKKTNKALHIDINLIIRDFKTDEIHEYLKKYI